jgi:hypothetical protein
MRIVFIRQGGGPTVCCAGETWEEKERVVTAANRTRGKGSLYPPIAFATEKRNSAGRWRNRGNGDFSLEKAIPLGYRLPHLGG